MEIVYTVLWVMIGVPVSYLAMRQLIKKNRPVSEIDKMSVGFVSLLFVLIWPAPAVAGLLWYIGKTLDKTLGG